MDRAIFWPLVAQTTLTGIVWLRLYFTRLREMRRRGISPQALASRTATATMQDSAAADNFANLFEVPVLFYAICVALAAAGLVTPLQLGLAWAFVGLRAAHSLVHVTYNRVMHRFAIYVAATLCVFMMWALFAISL
jgi:hypothetical protein